MITLDIAPSLANIKDRQLGNNPLTAFFQGQQMGTQAAIGRNQLATINRENAARPLAGAALNGDAAALKQLNLIDPTQGNQIATATGQDYKSKMDRSGAILFAAKDGTPEQKVAAVQAAGQIMGTPPDPHELDPNNFGAVLAQHQSLSQLMDQRNQDRNYALAQGGQKIQQATLDNNISNQNRNYGLDQYKAAVDAWSAAGGMLSGQPMPQPPSAASGGIGAGTEQVGAYPGGDGITTADQGGVFKPQTVQAGGGGAPPQAVAQAIPQGRPQVVLDPKTGAPDPVSQQKFLDALPPNVAPLVKSAANYTMDPNKMFSLKGNQRAMFDSMVQQYSGGNYDAQSYPLRYNMNKAVTTGQYASTLNSSEKVIQHMALLKDYADALQNGNVQTINAIKNRVSAEFGNAAATNFSVLANGVGTELAKAMKGTGTVDVGSIDEAQKAFGTNLSPAQISGAITTGMHMLASAVNPISNRYQEVMGKPLQWSGPQTSKALQKLGLDPADFGGGSTGGGAQQAPAGNVIIYDAQGNRVQ